MIAADPPVARVAPPPILATGAPAAVLAALPGARAVGGAVRDTLAGRVVQDVDVAAPFPPEAMAARLGAAGLKVFETGLAHGTLTAVLDHQPVEVTSLRRDVVTDGRHAEVVWTTDWREDAARRDFTINALSMSAAGEVWDYFGGRGDLAAGVVRFVGDPAARLAEDYLRALRFFRFQARYGSGAPDAAALAAIRAAVPGLARLSVERVWMELKRLLTAPDPAGAIRLMRETGVLPAVLPEADAGGLLERLLALGAPADPLLRLAALIPGGADAAGPLANRLKLSGEERDGLHRRLMRDLEASLPDPDNPKAVAAWLARRCPPEEDLGFPADLAWLREARSGQDLTALRAVLAAMPVPRLPVQGRDVLALGVAPGRAVGLIMLELRGWWVEDPLARDRAACLGKLRELVAAAPI